MRWRQRQLWIYQGSGEAVLNVHSDFASVNVYLAAEEDRDSPGNLDYHYSTTGSDSTSNRASLERAGSGQYWALGHCGIHGLSAVRASHVAKWCAASSGISGTNSAPAPEASGPLVDRESENEFKRVWRRLDKTEEDRLQLVRVGEAVKFLAKKVDRFSAAVTLLAVTVTADLISHYIK